MSEPITDVRGVVWRGLIHLKDEDYHGKAPGLSSTFLKGCMRSPAHALAEKKATPALAFGIAVHCALLEPERFAKVYVAEPRWKHPGNIKAGKDERSDWYDQFPEDDGPIFLDADEGATIDAMRESAYRSRTFRWLMDDSRRELAGFWECPETGELCKLKSDFWHGGDVIADLKTTENAHPDAFWRDIAKYDYPLSAAHYAKGLQAITGDSQSFVWIALEKKPPYGISFHVATPEIMAVGAARRLKAIERWKAWDKLQPAYPDSIVEPALPHWYMKGTANEQ